MSAWELRNGWTSNFGILSMSVSKFWNHVVIVLRQHILEWTQYGDPLLFLILNCQWKFACSFLVLSVLLLSQDVNWTLSFCCRFLYTIWTGHAQLQLLLEMNLGRCYSLLSSFKNSYSALILPADRDYYILSHMNYNHISICDHFYGRICNQFLSCLGSLF